MARGKKHTAEQIVNLLRQVEVGVADGTYYRWRKEYGGLKVHQAIVTFASQYDRYGYRRITALLKRAGLEGDHRCATLTLQPVQMLWSAA